MGFSILFLRGSGTLGLKFKFEIKIRSINAIHYFCSTMGDPTRQQRAQNILSFANRIVPDVHVGSGSTNCKT